MRIQRMQLLRLTGLAMASVLMSAAGAVWAAPEKVALPEAVIPVCETPPVLDGALDDAAWKKAAALGDLHVVGKDARTDKHRVLLCRDDQWLYVAFDVALPADRMPVTYGWHQSEQERKLHLEDHVALSFDPTGNSSFFYQLWVNRANVRAESRFSKGRGWELDWDIPWRSAAREMNGRWQVEMAVPWVLLFSKWGPDTGRFNVMVKTVTPQRDQQGVVVSENVEEVSWAPLALGFREPERFGYLRIPAGTRFREPFLPLLGSVAVSPYGVEAGSYFYAVTLAATNASAIPGAVTLEVADEPAQATQGARSFRERLGAVFGRAATAQSCTVNTNVALAGHAAATVRLPVFVKNLEQRNVTVRMRAADSGALLQVSALREAPEFNVLTAFLDRNYYTVEPAAVAHCRVSLPAERLAGHSLRIEDEGRKTLAASPVTVPDLCIDVPLAGLPDGQRFVKAVLCDAKGRPLAEQRMALVKRAPKPPCEWKVDRVNRILLDNGRPFFPFGVIAASPVEPYYFKTIADMGFNSIIQWSGDRDPTSADQFLALAQQHQLRVIFAPEIYSRWDDTTRVADPGGILTKEQCELLNTRLKNYGGTLLRMKGLLYPPFAQLPKSQKTALFLEYYRNNLPYMAAAVTRATNHPAVIGYIIQDEPLLELGQDAIGQAFYAELNRRDGYRPVFVLYSSWIPNTPDAMNWSDALGTDPYWVPGLGAGRGGRDTIQFMTRTVALTKQRADSIRSVTWTVPMAEYWSGCTKRALNADEQRCQTYLALIQGTKGIFYFKFPLESLEMMETLKDLAAQMKTLGPVCLQPEVNHTIAYSPGVLNPLQNQFTDVQAALKSNPAGGYVLLAANSANYPVDAKITLSGINLSGTIGRLFATNTCAVADGGFADRFEPYGVRAYLISDQRSEVRDQREKESTAQSPQPTASIRIAMTALTNEAVRETGYDRRGRLEKRNRMPNPSYEEASLKGWPDYHRKNWGKRESLESLIGGKEQNWGLSTEQPFHGKQCLMLVTTNETDQVITETSLLVKNDRSRDYVVSAYLRANRDDVKVTLKVAKEHVFTLNREWKRYHVAATLPAGESYAGLTVILRRNPGDTTVWVDALQFEEGQVPTEFEP